MNPVTIELTVNGEEHQVQVPARRLLADLLRDDLNLTGTKRGCETGICGACSVLVDGEVVKSCLMLAMQARGRHVMTVEGLAADGQLHPLQQSFMEHGGLQCGYCTPGFLMAACALLANNPNPTEEEVRHGLNGNLCRCTGYVGIVESVLSAAEAMRGN
ncbi:(2Fe-2S)-binding protein [Cupriavidus sp. WGtm5]|uniref:(2Fe-2S)-binding protein n=1 Tax=Cupriavidus TaxID=106589 RepID=UPI000E1052AA|nr:MULTISPECIES: (2Fe-2S)-binding protein [Cupriavidus]MCO4890878.1 (2Fe-2S)-binding protein [Cupriavidus sp. WGtm5]ULX51036.1 ferredoxin [Cupriavidus taiwanensis]SPA41127.1 4-hydroxybenzoyl-CoA reductase HbaB subunit [Cupriavidus taiwanensis]SPA42057.1 4-hydroxybenzoyl-CoA reductase HbaB subunit [Cupriavidus taiwanensis]